MYSAKNSQLSSYGKQVDRRVMANALIVLLTTLAASVIAQGVAEIRTARLSLSLRLLEQGQSVKFLNAQKSAKIIFAYPYTYTYLRFFNEEDVSPCK